MSATAKKLEVIWKRLQLQLDENKRSIRELQRNKIAERAAAPLEAAYADLPATPSQMVWYYVTDGRKQGETAGNGTGVLAAYDPTAAKWFNLYEGGETEVTI